MSSKSETGHAKNVANFYSLISFVVGYGADYNPSKPTITVPALQATRRRERLSLVPIIR
jgi:hypothetical protein